MVFYNYPWDAVYVKTACKQATKGSACNHFRRMEQSYFSYIFQLCTIFWYNIKKKDTEGENMGIGGIIVGLILLLFHVLENLFNLWIP